ncbi:hypothetical protein MH117_15040 [Paenibacillus sp. ACRRX]|uniref:hypothetical protein n=1 Tax=Paenibacillus sp. ACRRX TaxID=2918206 RepID=UPI001EF5C5FE|nr:hypothetical protein [Paenibacillus sp. ACRRX]MCG7408746.1 hypothetical protein [Paenibacillus sp. ACRRX]
MYQGLPMWQKLYMHVKWFTTDQEWTPQAINKVITPTFLFWLCFTVAVLLLTAIFNESIDRIGIVRKVHSSLNSLKRFQQLVLRVGLGLGLILQLFTGTYLAPTLVSNDWWVYAVLVVAILGLLHRKSLFVSGAALTTLYIKALTTYGLFHALDYMFYLGIMYYLFVAETRWYRTAIPVLYICTGLSLAWLAMEKMTLAKLACSLMHEYGLPTLGFTVEDFVLISAFIEMGLAWAFIVGLMNRFTALLLTGVFLATTTVFGFTEIVGHTVVHTLLIIFLIVGREDRKILFEFKQTSKLRYTFVAVNFCVMLFGMMLVYVWMGQPANGFVVQNHSVITNHSIPHAANTSPASTPHH